MTDITQRDYVKVLSDVTRHLSLLIRDASIQNGQLVRSNSSCLCEHNVEALSKREQFIKQYFENDQSIKNSFINNNDLKNYYGSITRIAKRKITLNDKLIKTMTIWYLPKMNKNGVYKNLKDKPIGHFIVTDNNENFINTNGKLSTLLLFTINEHKQLTRHLIKIYNQTKFKLNNSKHTFASLISLIEFYINNKEDLNFELTLPDRINKAVSLQQLNSLSLLEEDFWTDENYFKEFNTNLDSPNSSSLQSNASDKITTIHAITPSYMNVTCNEENFINNKSNTLTNGSVTSDKDTSSSSSSSLRRNDRNGMSINRRRCKIENRTGFLRSDENNIKQSIDKLNNNNSANPLTTTSTRNSLILAKNNPYTRHDEVLNKQETQKSKKQLSTRFNPNTKTTEFSPIKMPFNMTNLKKRHSKSLDELSWPLKYMANNSGNNTTNSNNNTNNKHRMNSSTIRINQPLQHQPQNSLQPSKSIIKKNAIKYNDFHEELPSIDENKLQKRSKFQLFKQSTTTISNFFANLFHKSTTSIHQNEDLNETLTEKNSQKQNNGKQQRHASAFNLANLDLNKKSKKISKSTYLHTTPAQTQQQQQQQPLQQQQQFDDTLSVNSCVTYVNPFFGSSVQKQQLTTREIPTISEMNLNDIASKKTGKATKFEDILNNSSIYSSLDEYDYIMNGHYQRTPSNSSIINKANVLGATINVNKRDYNKEENVNMDSMSLESTDINNDESLLSSDYGNYSNEIKRHDGYLDYHVKREQSLPKDDKKLLRFNNKESFRRSSSMTQPKRNRNSSITLKPSDNLVIVNNEKYYKNTRKSNEYSEPFDIIAANMNNTAKSIPLNHFTDDLITIEQLKAASILDEPHYSSIELNQINKNIQSSGYFSSDAKLNDWSENEIISLHDTARSEFNFSLVSTSIPIDKALKCVISNDYETVSDLMLDSIKLEEESPLENVSSTKDEQLNDTFSNDSEDMIDEDSETETLYYAPKMTTLDVLCQRHSNLIQYFEDRDQMDHNNNNTNSNKTVESKHTRLQNVDATIKQSKYLERTLTFQLTQNSNDLLNKIKTCLFDLSCNDKSIVNSNISEFINCILNTTELNPYSVMSNIRQFMNGIKNYLINESLVEIFQNLKKDKNLSHLLNIDLLIEICIQMSVLKQLKAKLYYLIVDWLVCDNTLLDMNNNIKALSDLNINVRMNLLCVNYVFDDATINLIRNYFEHLQFEYAPLEKLKFMLLILNELVHVYEDTIDISYLNLFHFIPLLIFTICVCGMNALQVEIDYILCLINKQLLNNEANYSLALLNSACFILKSLKIEDGVCKPKTNHLIYNCKYSYLTNSLLNILTPDEKNENFQLCTIPIRHNSRAKDICNLIAFKLKLINNDDYALFLISYNDVDDDDDCDEQCELNEKKLKDDDLPFEIRCDELKFIKRKIVFIYRHKLANFIWPKNIFDIEKQFLENLI